MDEGHVALARVAKELPHLLKGVPHIPHNPFIFLGGVEEQDKGIRIDNLVIAVMSHDMPTMCSVYVPKPTQDGCNSSACIEFDKPVIFSGTLLIAQGLASTEHSENDETIETIPTPVAQLPKLRHLAACIYDPVVVIDEVMGNLEKSLADQHTGLRL